MIAVFSSINFNGIRFILRIIFSALLLIKDESFEIRFSFAKSADSGELICHSMDRMILQVTVRFMPNSIESVDLNNDFNGKKIESERMLKQIF